MENDAQRGEEVTQMSEEIDDSEGLNLKELIGGFIGLALSFLDGDWNDRTVAGKGLYLLELPFRVLSVVLFLIMVAFFGAVALLHHGPKLLGKAYDSVAFKGDRRD
jgi:hypothetical protein